MSAIGAKQQPQCRLSIGSGERRPLRRWICVTTPTLWRLSQSCCRVRAMHLIDDKHIQEAYLGG